MRENNSGSRFWQGLRPHAGLLAAACGALLGAGLYFGLAVNPPPEVWVPLGIVFIAALGIWKTTHAQSTRIACGALILALTTFAAAHQQTGRAAHTVLPYPVLASKAHWLTGTVAGIETTTKKRTRLTLENPHIYGTPIPVQLQSMVVTLESKRGSTVQPGQAIAAQVVFMAPQGAAHPYARDFRLWKFLDEGTPRGYVHGEFHVQQALPARTDTPPTSLLSGIEHLRARIAGQTASLAQGVVSALLVGEYRAIPSEIIQAYRASGLMHLMAISGMQLSIIGLGLFWLIRRALAQSSWLALHVNIKAYAAAGALLGVTGYALLAGAGMGVVRALLMVGLLLVAYITGRLRNAVRAWGLAVLAMLLVYPAAVTQAGFLLSISAVGALVLLGISHPQLLNTRPRLGTWLEGLTLTSIVAGAATLPVIAIMFGQLSVVSLLANLVAVPYMVPVTWLSLLVLVVTPIGMLQPLAGVLQILLGYSVTVLNHWALLLAGLPVAEVYVSPATAYILVLPCLGVMALVYARKTGWALALMACTLTIASIGNPKPPVALLAEGGATALVRNAAGGYTQVWGRPLTRSWPGFPLTEGESLTRIVRLETAPDAEACANAGLILAAEAGGACPAKTLADDTFSYATLGTNAEVSTRKKACERPWQQLALACGKR